MEAGRNVNLTRNGRINKLKTTGAQMNAGKTTNSKRIRLMRLSGEDRARTGLFSIWNYQRKPAVKLRFFAAI
jgi:hypothetical protein